MPLQNRVTPTGEIVAIPARGLMMGNRGGKIHAPDRTLGTRRWASRQWILCLLAFKDRQREVMGAGYTELFFLDEVTGLAAGHRPCFECRRAAAKAFIAGVPDLTRAPELDRALHAARLAPRQMMPARDLPDGTMVLIEDAPHALRGGQAWPWSFNGYRAPRAIPTAPLPVLTPPPTLSALSSGYRPLWHPSAGGSGS